MDNPQALATLGTQDTGQRKTKPEGQPRWATRTPLVVKPRWATRTPLNTGGETKMSNTDFTKHWWWNQDEQHGPHQTLVVKPRWEARTPPNTGGETKMSNTDPTKHWWWNQDEQHDPTKHWWWNQDEQHGPHQTLVVKPRGATRTPPNTGGETKMLVKGKHFLLLIR